MQLYNCISYIHYNPVKANIVKEPKDYEFTTYTDYINTKGIVDREVLELTYGAGKDYLEMFYTMHNRINSEEIKDVEEEKVEAEQIIAQHEEKTRLKLEEIIKDTLLCRNLIMDLTKMSGMSLRKIGEIVKLNKGTVNRIIRK